MFLRNIFFIIFFFPTFCFSLDLRFLPYVKISAINNVYFNNNITLQLLNSVESDFGLKLSESISFELKIMNNFMIPSIFFYNSFLKSNPISFFFFSRNVFSLFDKFFFVTFSLDKFLADILWFKKYTTLLQALLFEFRFGFGFSYLLHECMDIQVSYTFKKMHQSNKLDQFFVLSFVYFF